MADYNITMKQLNSSGTYDTLYPATIGSQVTGITGDQISGIYTADQTLTSATAALFGLGTDAVPDDVFAKISEHISALESAQIESALGDFTSSVTLPFTPDVVFIVCASTATNTTSKSAMLYPNVAIYIQVDTGGANYVDAVKWDGGTRISKTKSAAIKYKYKYVALKFGGAV